MTRLCGTAMSVLLTLLMLSSLTRNLIVKSKGGTTLWQSFDSPTDTLLPTQNITASKKLVSTGRLLDHGNYSFHFDDQYLLSLFYYQRDDISRIYWPDPTRTIWTKKRVQFNSTTIGSFDSWGYFQGSDNLTITAADWGPGIMRRLTLDYDGNLRLYSLNKADGRWSVTWQAYPVLCIIPGLCGKNGICVNRPVASCACAPGFEAIDPSDRSKGCNRKINISGDAQNVKFIKLSHTDFRDNDMNVHRSISLHDCKNICLNDSRCEGFQYQEGLGDCYPKFLLYGGVTLHNLGDTKNRYTMYIKVHKQLQVLESSIPQPQPFGPNYYVPDCRSPNEYMIAHFSDVHKSSQNESKYVYLYGFLSAVFLAEVVFIVLGWIILKRERREMRGAWPAEDGYEMIPNHFRRYTYKELVAATAKFKDELGRGASGVVYKGVLKDQREVAVKKLEDISQGEEEFQHELSVISRIYHMNLVRVWGFCSDGPHRILVSEYIEKGSLDKILFGTERSGTLLGWKQRFDVALGVARGLAYLHHECLEWVIHCDVKPENILLDKNLVPKIADFGVSKLMNRGRPNLNVSQIRGTRGYLAPEWVSSLPITAKVDVYSFGVVLLELQKGARISDMEENEDLQGVENALGRMVRMLKEKLQLDDGSGEEGWIDDFIDARLNGQFNRLQAETMMKLAVSCLEEDRNKRPTMEDAVQVLVSVDEVNSPDVTGEAA